MPTITVISTHHLSSTFSKPTRPYISVHLGLKSLGKTSSVFEAADRRGTLHKWFEDDATATFSFTDEDVENMNDSEVEEDEDGSIISSADADSDSDSDSDGSKSNQTGDSDADDSDNDDSSSTGSGWSEDSADRPEEIYVEVHHAASSSRRKNSKSRSAFLGRVTIPLADIQSIPAGAPLTQTYPLQPVKGMSTKHVQGSVTLKLLSGTVNELLKFLLKTHTTNSSSQQLSILQRSKANRENSTNISTRVDATLDKYWNQLEANAAAKVDKQLIAEGLIVPIEEEEEPMSYIQQVMTGAIFKSALKKPKSPVVTDSASSTPAIKGTSSAITKRNKRKATTGVDLQPLNQGVHERAQAEHAARRRGARMRAWVEFDEEDESKCKPHPISLSSEDHQTFGIGVELHFSLMRWFQTLTLALSLAAVYLTYLTYEAYENDVEKTSDDSIFMRVSSLSFKDSAKVPLAYSWVLTGQVTLTVLGMTWIRIMIKRKRIQIESATVTSADFSVECTHLPRKYLTGDPSRHSLESTDDDQTKRGKKKKKKKKKKKPKKSVKSGQQELTAQDVKDHFSQWGPVIHVALAFDVNAYCKLVDSRDEITKRIEVLHQQRAISTNASGRTKTKMKKKKEFEKKLEKTYAELSKVDQKIRRMDMGDKYSEEVHGVIPFSTGCCTFDSTARHQFKTTGHAFVMFRYARDAKLCLKELNSQDDTHAYRAFKSLGGQTMNTKMMKKGGHASTWASDLKVKRPCEPKDLIWWNLEYTQRDILIRQFAMWAVILPLSVVGLGIDVVLSQIKTQLNSQCLDSSADDIAKDVLFPQIRDFVEDNFFKDDMPAWFCDYYLVYVSTLLTSGTIVLINLVLTLTIQSLTRRLERSHKRSNILGKLVFRIALMKFINVCLAMLFTYDVFEMWHVQGDLLDSVCLFMIINTFAPITALFLKSTIDPFLKSLKRKKAMTTRQLNESFMPPEYDIHLRYVYTITTFMTAQFFLSLVPAISLLAFAGLAVARLCDRTMLLRVCDVKKLLYLSDAAAVGSVRFCANLSVLTSVAGFFYMSVITAPDSSWGSILETLEKEAIQPYSIVIWVVVILYISLPLWREWFITQMEKSKKKSRHTTLGFDTPDCCYDNKYLLCCGKSTMAKGSREDEEEDEVEGRGKNSKEIGDEHLGDFFNDERLLNSTKHYSAPTPTCMLPYQRVNNSKFHNQAVDAIVILDGNGDGEMHADEFQVALRSLGVELKDNQAKAVVELFDANGDGFVSTHEFMDAAEKYVDEDGRIDFFMFAHGIVAELEEEFGRIRGLDDDTESDSDVSDVAGSPRYIKRRSPVENDFGQGDAPTRDVLDLEEMISRRWKVQHHEKEGIELAYEDYQDTGIKRPRHVMHKNQKMSQKQRASYAYHQVGTSPTKVVSPLGKSPARLESSAKGRKQGDKGYWSSEGHYVSKAEAKEEVVDDATVRKLFELSEIHVAAEAEDVYYNNARKDSVEDDLSATVLKFAASGGRGATAAFDNMQVVEKLADLQMRNGSWKMNAALCVHMKVRVGDCLHGKPHGVELGMWATMLALAYFEVLCARERAGWELSAKMAKKWLEHRSAADERWDNSVKRKAVKFLKEVMELGGGDEDEADEERGGGILKYSPKRKVVGEGKENAGSMNAGSMNRRANLTDEVRVGRAGKTEDNVEEEQRRKMMMMKWKESSFNILGKMTGKERFNNPLEDWFMYPEEGGEEKETEKEAAKEAFRRSVQFEKTHANNMGEVGEAKVPVAPASDILRTPGRHGTSFWDGAVVGAGGAGGEVQSLGLGCSVFADGGFYVEVKVLCARHFVMDLPPVPPGAALVRKNRELVCVPSFGTVTGKGVACCAGGCPPGWMGAGIRFHVSREYSLARFKVWGGGGAVAVGELKVDLARQIEIGGLDAVHKMFVFDLERDGERGGHWGQLCMSMCVRRGGGKGKEEEKESAATTRVVAKKALAKEILKDNEIVGGKEDVTKTYNVKMGLGKGVRKKIPWTVPSGGSYVVISSVPSLVVPMTERIEAKLGEDHDRCVRLSFIGSSVAMKAECKVVIKREEDGLVVECLLFQVEVVGE